MAVRRDWMLTGVVLSVLVHCLSLDGMRYAMAPVPARLPLQVSLRDDAHESSVRVTPLPAQTIHPRHKNPDMSSSTPRLKQPSSAFREQSVVEKPVPVVEVASKPEPSDDSSGLGGMFRPMELEELQAMARIRIAQALVFRQRLISTPVVLRVRLSAAGVPEVDIVEPVSGDANDLRENVLRLLRTNLDLMPSASILPLEIEFQSDS